MNLLNENVIVIIQYNIILIFQWPLKYFYDHYCQTYLFLPTYFILTFAHFQIILYFLYFLRLDWIAIYFSFFFFFYRNVSFYEHKCKTSVFLFYCLTESRVLLNITFYHSGPSLGHSLLQSIASVIVFPSPPPLGLLHSSLISAHPHGNPVSHAISTRCCPANGWPASVTSSSGCCSAWKSRVGLDVWSSSLGNCTQ